jgi:hypothetical protein
LSEFAPKNSRNPAEVLTVEILWIEINDFMTEASGSTRGKQ